MIDSTISFFSEITSTQRGSILAIGLMFFWVLEGFLPYRIFNYNKFKHATTNIFFTLTTILVNFSLAFLIVLTCDFVSSSEFGLLSYFNIVEYQILSITLTLMLLDLIAAYFSHFVQHKINILWNIHMVHHSDKYVDTTTANRHHPIESVVRFFFTLFAILISGASIEIVFLYQSLSVAFSQFNHANIGMSDKFDKFLSYVIVSPNMHKVHHHSFMPYTDSNYGNIFSIWDRVFGTYKELDKNKIIFGIDDNYDDKNNFIKILKRPFRKN
tara:strand:- start:708 stop:1517 length:810 start_codon:yes stop_codon:yes gene_type:complete